MQAVELKTFPRRRLLVGVTIAALLWIVGGSIPARSQTSAAADVLGRAFDVSKGEGKIWVGKKGKAQREFAVESDKSPGKLGLTLREQGGSSQTASFSYDEKNRLIDVGLGGSRLKINIRPDGTVAVADNECGGNDAACVAAAVASALPELRAEEVAAAVAALEDDLVGMERGSLILDAMRQLAQQLVSAG